MKTIIGLLTFAAGELIIYHAVSPIVSIGSALMIFGALLIFESAHEARGNLKQ
jgi:hypothetical protein